MSSTEQATPTVRLKNLVAAALLGTDRSGRASAPAVAAEIAVISCMARAGYAPSPGANDLPPCPKESLHPVSGAASGMLSQLLAHPDAAMISEWLSLATGKQQRVPHSLLPALLDWGAVALDRTLLVRAVLGSRGRWLPSLNPQWKTLGAGEDLSPDAAAQWSTSSTPERLALLAAVRRAKPSLAAELVASTSQHDTADERRRFISQFATGISDGDEPFLEAALDDRSKAVRETASTLLASLPTSGYTRRMTDRARAAVKHVALKKGLLRKKNVAIAVALPAKWTPDLERDGLEQKPPSGIGERAWWMQQIVARTPPRSLFGETPPEDVLAAAGDTEYADSLPAALRDAAARFGDVEWSVAIALYELGLPQKKKFENLPTIPDGLSTEHFGAVVVALISDDRFGLQASWSYAAGIPRPWPMDLSKQVAKALAKKKAKAPPQWHEIGPGLEEISRSLHPDAAPELISTLHAMFKDDISPAIAKCIDRLAFRTEMHKEFRS